jgi:hydrogenase maturation protease
MERLTVLGVGNVLMRDDGVGVRVLEAVRAARTWPGGAEFIDGGVGGLNLLNVIEQADRLVIFDAADLRLPPGQWRVITPEQVADEPAAGRLSLHDAPLLETCGCASGSSAGRRRLYWRFSRAWWISAAS